MTPTTAPTTAESSVGLLLPQFWESVGLGDLFRETPWTGWLVLAAFIFIGLAAGRVIRFICDRLTAKAARRNWTTYRIVVRSVAGPLGLIAFTTCFMAGMTWLVLRPPMQRFTLQIGQLLFAYAAGWLMWNLTLVVELILRRITSRTKNPLDDQLAPLVRRTLRIVLSVMLVLFVAENVFHADVTSFIAGLGIAGLAISLAAQDTVRNFFGSLAIILDQPFMVGDVIAFDKYRGTVIDIGLRTTRLRTANGSIVTIPNSKLSDSPVEKLLNTSATAARQQESAPVQPPVMRSVEVEDTPRPEEAESR